MMLQLQLQLEQCLDGSSIKKLSLNKIKIIREYMQLDVLFCNAEMSVYQTSRL